MKHRLVAGFLVLLVSGPACSSDSDDSGDDQAGLKDGGAGPAGPCVGQEEALGRDFDESPSGTNTVTDIAGTCGVSCLSDADPETCVNTCIQAALPAGAITADCTLCSAKSVVCFISNCAARCGADPNADDCKKCGCGDNPRATHCIDVYSECSGVPDTTYCASVGM